MNRDQWTAPTLHFVVERVNNESTQLDQPMDENLIMIQLWMNLN